MARTVTPGVNEAAWLLQQWVEHYLEECHGGAFSDDLVLRSGAFLQAHAPEFMAALRQEREGLLETLRGVGVVYADTGENV